MLDNLDLERPSEEELSDAAETVEEPKLSDEDEESAEDLAAIDGVQEELDFSKLADEMDQITLEDLEAAEKAEEVSEPEVAVEEAEAPAVEEKTEEVEEAPVIEEKVEEVPAADEVKEEKIEETVIAEEINDKKEEEKVSEEVKEMEEQVTAEVKEETSEKPARDLEYSEETAIITKGMTINGDVESNGNLDILGAVKGNIDIVGKINVQGTIVGNSKAHEVFADGADINGEINVTGSAKIGQNSVVIGNISAASAVIAGAVKGDIDVQGPVVLDSTAIVMGNIKSMSVQINTGAVIEGMCSQCYAEVNPTSFFEEFKKSAKTMK